MATSGQYIVIGVFDDPVSADRSLTALLQAGFSQDQLRHTTTEGSEHTSPKGIKALFSGEKAMPHKNVMDDLVNMGVEPNDARIYQKEYEAGHPLVSVTGKGNMQDAINIMLNQGAHAPEELAKRKADYQVSDRQTGVAGTRASESRSTGNRPVGTPGTRAGEVRTTGNRPTEMTSSRAGEVRATGNRAADMAASRTDEESSVEVTESQKMRLHAERLRAYKEPDQVSEVSVHKEVITEQQTLNVPVTREEVVIKRRSLAEDASEAETPIGEGEDIRIPVREEKVNVSKEEIVTGEVEISKRKIKENRQFSDMVRHEEAYLENKDNIPIIDSERNQPPPQPQV